MGTKKRRRSESFQAEQGEDGDARKRLAAFHARMFELPQEETAFVAPETPRVMFKAKHKKHTKKSAGGDDEEPVPVVKFNKTKPIKEKKKKIAPAAMSVKVTEKKVVTVPAVVNARGTLKSDLKEKMVAKKVKKVKKLNNVEVKKTIVQTPQWHSMQKDEGDEEDGMDPLEQALKEIKTKKTAKPPHKKHKTVTGKAVPVLKKRKSKKSLNAVEEKHDAVKGDVDNNVDDGDSTEHLSKREKINLKKKQKKMRALEANDSKLASVHQETSTGEAKNSTSAAGENVTRIELTSKKTDSDSTLVKTSAASPKSGKNRKKSPKVKMNSISPKTQGRAQFRQGKPLLLSDKADNENASESRTVNDANAVMCKKTKIAPEKKGKKATKTAVQTKKVAVDEEKKPAMPTKLLTPIAASLVKDAKKKNDMFLPTRETSRQPATSTKPIQKAVPLQVVQLTAESSSSENEAKGGFDFDHQDVNDSSLFSRLIDSAARERWELVEVGRLARLFAAEWDFNESKTGRFLRETCPELVSVDFLEGLGVNLSAKQLMQVFEAGSGNSTVLMNKMASAVENGHLSVRDPSFVSSLERRVALMESNAEVMELLHPLLESLSTVHDVGCLLKKLCEHWQLERKLALVQQVLLSSVFDDLDGNQDDILFDLPDLAGRLDFPSRLDQEDVDENGNLKGFLVNEDSDISGEEGSEEEEDDEEDSEDGEVPYEGETDSDEEVEISGRPRRRNQFIEDEADVGEEEEEEEEEKEHRDNNGELSSSSDSD